MSFAHASQKAPLGTVVDKKFDFLRFFLLLFLSDSSFTSSLFSSSPSLSSSSSSSEGGDDDVLLFLLVLCFSSSFFFFSSRSISHASHSALLANAFSIATRQYEARFFLSEISNVASSDASAKFSLSSNKEAMVVVALLLFDLLE